MEFKRTHNARTYSAEEALEYHLLDIDPYEYGGELERLKEQVNRLRGMLVKLALLLPEPQLAHFVEEVTYMQQVKEKQ